MTIKIKLLPHALGMPTRGSKQAAGWDLQHADPNVESVHLFPNTRYIFPTGVSIELPAGKEAQIRSRSGMAAKEGIFVLNSPGTIDADYRGEICVILCNNSNQRVTIKRGDRIAQMVIADVCMDELEQVEELGDTGRGSGGMGSTGK